VSCLKLLPYRDLARIAEAAGFQRERYKGSHNMFRAADGRIVVIPDHGRLVIVHPLLRKLIRDMGRPWMSITIISTGQNPCCHFSVR
jgi:predicted RNA binding protein YcfA (HicA-like mRNA interferase family)